MIIIINKYILYIYFNAMEFRLRLLGFMEFFYKTTIIKQLTK